MVLILPPPLSVTLPYSLPPFVYCSHASMSLTASAFVSDAQGDLRPSSDALLTESVHKKKELVNFMKGFFSFPLPVAPFSARPV